MIGITGVTGKLGSYVADLVDQQGISSIHLARRPERAKVYASAEIRKMVYANTPEVVDALKGIDVLLMVSARENPERVEEHKSFLDAAKLAGVQHIVYTSFYGADEKATFTLSRDHAQTEAYIKKLGFTYTFLRDNFYLDFFIDIALENGEIRGPAGRGRVSAVARKDTSRVAAEILLNPKEWENQTLNLTGPEDLSMEEIENSGLGPYYIDHTVGIWPQAAGGVPFNACEFQSKGDPITDLFEDLAAEQKARSTYDNILRVVKNIPEVADPIRFLRAREVVHFQRFGEALRSVQEQLDAKNFYAFNPSFDAPCKASCEE